MHSVAAGKLEHRVTVQRLSASVNGAGHLDENTAANWQNIGKRWCEIVTRGSREFFRGSEVAAEITHQVTMRSDSQSREFTEKHRLVYGSKTLNIAGPPQDVDEARVLIRFPATEVRNA